MTKQEITEVLKKNNRWMTAKDIAKELGKEKKSVSKPLTKLRKHSDIHSKRKKEGGFWKYFYIHEKWL